MIVKKTAILQGFTPLKDLKNHLKNEGKSDNFRPVFYDIETTGLSRFSTFCYLIGAARYNGDFWELYQWLGEGESDEPLILKAFFDFISEYNTTVQYNGNRFDQPYLEYRSSIYKIPCVLSSLTPIDIYQKIRHMDSFFKLAALKQTDVEQFCNIPQRTFCSGKECIHLYRQYLKTKDSVILEHLFEHNQEDLQGLIQLLPVLSFQSLYRGDFLLQDSAFDQEEFSGTLLLPYRVPSLLSNGTNLFYITCQDNKVRFLIRTKDNKLRFYYSDYKNYVYLPAEDTAIPKALSKFMDRKLFIPAQKETCYTWISCDDKFRTDFSRQETYLKRQLPLFLSFL